MYQASAQKNRPLVEFNFLVATEVTVHVEFWLTVR